MVFPDFEQALPAEISPLDENYENDSELVPTVSASLLDVQTNAQSASELPSSTKQNEFLACEPVSKSEALSQEPDLTT